MLAAAAAAIVGNASYMLVAILWQFVAMRGEVWQRLWQCGNCGNADTQRVKSIYACGNSVAICGNERRSVAKVVANATWILSRVCDVGEISVTFSAHSLASFRLLPAMKAGIMMFSRAVNSGRS